MRDIPSSGARTARTCAAWRRYPRLCAWLLGAIAGVTGCRADLPCQLHDALTGSHATPAVSYLATLTPPGEVTPAAHLEEGSESRNSPPVPVARLEPVTGVVCAAEETPIDLASALRRAGASNPTIALAREAVQVSRAEQLQADVLMVPSLQAGTSFDLHRGVLERPTGIILNVDRQSLYAGAGAAAIGTGTVGYPGVNLTFHVVDALFEPTATRQIVAARGFEAVATQNNMLLAVAVAYFELAGAEARLAALRLSQTEVDIVADLTVKQAKAGQGRESDANRARSEQQLLLAASQNVQEEAAVAAAELARLLDLDPALRLRPPGGPLPVVQFVDPRSDLESLVQTAMANHPELRALSEELAAAETRLRKEIVRPWVPFVAVGYSAGGFGGGSNLVSTNLGNFNTRTDLDVMAVWTFRNLGLGNLSIQRQNRGQVAEAQAERSRVANAIRRAVAEALALCNTRLRDEDIARRRVTTSAAGFRADLLRARNLEARPIEVLNSLDLLTRARQELIRARVGYNQAQFQLLVAVGQTPRSGE